VVTRNDHTRSTDRSQDIFVPVTFAEGPGTPPDQAPSTTLPPPPPTTAPTTTSPASRAPISERSTDGLSASDGARTLHLSAVSDLDPAAAELVVRGEGFDVGRGVYVSLCAAPAPGSADAPEPCLTGSRTASAWVSSNPPDYGRDLAVPYGDDGSFEVALTVASRIDAEHDCREIACAVVVRSDEPAGDDRSLDLAVPVRFAAEPATATTAEPGAGADPDAPGGDAAASEGEAAVSPARDGGPSGGSTVALVLGALVTVSLGVGGAAAVARRRAGVATP
jgi:hypothetical protein